jgi:multidrug efflux pump subunit AcrA (membrane-fusion protein)
MVSVEGVRTPSGDALELLRLQVAALAPQTFAQAAAAFATALCDRMGCERVSVGWLKRGRSEVSALSHSADFDRRQAVLEKIAAAMDEAIEQAGRVVLPEPDDTTSQVALAHRELIGGSGQRAVCTVLLAQAAQPLGAITLERTERFGPHDIAFCEDAAWLAASILALKSRAERSWLALAGEALGRLASPTGRRARLAWAAAAAVLAALLLAPVPYHVTAPARVEGAVQRVVVAPVDGFLEQVNARAGDKVGAGQVLAELATRDLQAERVKRQSELAQHENVYKTAMARADRAQLVVHQAKAAETRAQLALIDNQLERSQLRAPFDGVIIKGDLAQQLGAPVQRGEVLFTVAPDRRFRLIVEVDERDIAQVRAGMAGQLALAAAPHQALAFDVARVLPVAVSADGRNYFEIEATLQGSGEALRPGLRGVAKIAAGRRAAAWIATHRLLDWLRLTAWSLGL